MCGLDILSERKYFIISWCNKCRKITVRHQNYILDFTTDSFNEFCNFVSELNFKTHVRECGGVEQIVVRADLPLRLCFISEEFEELKHALKEASLMLQVYGILRN